MSHRELVNRVITELSDIREQLSGTNSFVNSLKTKVDNRQVSNPSGPQVLFTQQQNSQPKPATPEYATPAVQTAMDNKKDEMETASARRNIVGTKKAEDPGTAYHATQATLSGAGLTPAFGAVPDLVAAGHSLLHGQFKDAAVNIGAAIPAIGQGVGAAKLANTGAKLVKSAVKGADVGTSLATTAMATTNTINSRR